MSNKFNAIYSFSPFYKWRKQQVNEIDQINLFLKITLSIFGKGSSDPGQSKSLIFRTVSLKYDKIHKKEKQLNSIFTAVLL